MPETILNRMLAIRLAGFSNAYASNTSEGFQHCHFTDALLGCSHVGRKNRCQEQLAPGYAKAQHSGKKTAHKIKTSYSTPPLVEDTLHKYIVVTRNIPKRSQSRWAHGTSRLRRAP